MNIQIISGNWKISGHSEIAFPFGLLKLSKIVPGNKNRENGPYSTNGRKNSYRYHRLISFFPSFGRIILSWVTKGRSENSWKRKFSFILEKRKISRTGKINISFTRSSDPTNFIRLEVIRRNFRGRSCLCFLFPKGLQQRSKCDCAFRKGIFNFVEAK